MTLDRLESWVLSKPGSGKSFPFGEEVAVYKVSHKIFAIVSLHDTPLRINLKAIPEEALVYRDIYPSVIPGYHMNKKHWNTVILDGTVPDEVVQEMVDTSYDLIVAKLTKREREALLKA
ncbi:MAG TPA: MmcQ/YjbR family DNA-binding protein [Epsilonproteobacteria bacterium]|nr:MmcQ/YjbR family DNA-binding protein [Campylobacterota bacterium]